jgi:hypothetical protein
MPWSAPDRTRSGRPQRSVGHRADASRWAPTAGRDRRSAACEKLQTSIPISGGRNSSNRMVGYCLIGHRAETPLHSRCQSSKSAESKNRCIPNLPIRFSKCWNYPFSESNSSSQELLPWKLWYVIISSQPPKENNISDKCFGCSIPKPFLYENKKQS